MIILNDRQYKILETIGGKKDYVTIKSLACDFDVSDRTIRYDLDKIEKALSNKKVELLRSPRYGTKLKFNGGNDYNSLLEILQYSNKSSYSHEERLILISLMVLNKNQITYDQIVEKLNVSKNTISQDIKKIKVLLSNFKIRLITKPYIGISIEGKEDDIRYAYMNLYYKSKSYKSIKLFQVIDLNPIIDLHSVKSVIHSIEKELGIQYSEGSIDELSIVIMHMLNRILQQKSIQYTNLYINDYSSREDFSIIEKKINDKFSNIGISKSEICYLNKWFRSAKIMSFLDVNLKERFNEQIPIISQIINDIGDFIGMDLAKDNQFTHSVAMHFNVAVYRLKNNLVIDNPLTEEIKYKIGLIYQITEDILKRYEMILDISFPESEIAYMAMHFGAIFERNANKVFIPKVLVVCNSGLSTSGLLNSRLHTMLPQLEVLGTCRLDNLDDYLKKQSIDFIISTIPIKKEGYKVVEVNPLLSLEDVQILKQLIFNNIYEKSTAYLVSRYKKNKFNKISNLISENNALFNVEVSDWKDAIKIAATPLLKENSIDKRYIDEMIKVVEELGTYMVFIPEIAFIHATPKYAFKNSISFLTLKEKIYFGNKSDVQIKAIAILVNKSENKNLIDLINILMKANNINRFKEINSYEDLEFLNE